MTERPAVQWLIGTDVSVVIRIRKSQFFLSGSEDQCSGPVYSFLLDSCNQVKVDCIINPRSTRFEPLSSIFRCTVSPLDPRRPPNDLQYVISNDSITFNVTVIDTQLFRRNGRATVALNLPVTFSKCRSKHTGPGCARSGGIVLHCKKTRSNNG
ncbi:hypothetical protein T10_7049 [Trichinella papuae]|uniref:Uncharacterized protein n=1 Tax=Trichinella papuae TaxID=268474 RepID=A0A0V1MPR9_9BILA|nr:hypothetical protein T10_7049 [Trichinella papuae]